MSVGIVYYSDCRPDTKILESVRKQLLRASHGLPIVSVTLKPVDFGINIVLPLERGRLTMFRQQLTGLEAINTDIVFMAEHDVLYHPSHFDFEPKIDTLYYYNYHCWRVNATNGQALFYYTKQVSGLCAYRSLLLQNWRERVRIAEAGLWRHSIGYEPGCHKRPRGLCDYTADHWMSPVCNVDIRHNHNFTKNRWSQDEFRDKNTCLGWAMADEIPGWSKTKGRFSDFLHDVEEGKLGT